MGGGPATSNGQPAGGKNKKFVPVKDREISNDQISPYLVNPFYSF